MDDAALIDARQGENVFWMHHVYYEIERGARRIADEKCYCRTARRQGSENSLLAEYLKYYGSTVINSTFEFQLSEQECIAALRHNQGRMARQSQRPALRVLFFVLYIAVWISVGLYVQQFGSALDARNAVALLIAASFALLLIFLVQQSMAVKRILSLIASPDSALRARTDLALAEQGLHLFSERGESLIAWRSIRQVEHIQGITLLYLDAAQFVPIPDSAFKNGEEREQFFAAVGPHLGTVEGQAQAPDAGLDQRSPERSGGALRPLLANLKLGLKSAFFLRITADQVQASWSQLITLLILAVGIQFTSDLLQVGLSGEFALQGLPAALFGFPVMLFAAWAITRLMDRPQHTLLLAVALSAISLSFDAAYTLLPFIDSASLLPRALQNWISQYSFHLLMGWFTLAAAVACVRLLSVRPIRRPAVALLVISLLWLPLSMVYRDPTLWKEAYNASAEAETQQAYRALESEDVFYLQPKLLERELAALNPGRKGVVDLYFIGAAGYSNQDVFMKEVHSVAQLFKERFDTEGRSVMLINNPKTVTESPIASVTSLRAVLKRVGEVMDRDEDIVFLFLTSHGSKDHKFSLDFGAMQFNELDPPRLRQILDEAGIKRRVVVVSACYSGGFVEALKDENSLIITASAADKNSFGCNNENDFTYFGKAYFDEALRKTRSFITAFELAKPVIAERERKEQYDSSDPRIFIGEKIRAALDQLGKKLPSDSSVAE